MAKEKEEKKNKKFFKDFKAELKKVIWPTPKQVLNNTVAVVVIVIITGIIVFALDTVFELANTFGINKVKQSIKNSISVTEEVTDNEVIEESNSVEVEETNSVE
ncbi:MAG: preprotein translocase subunit SecE [Clostridiales bacterium]|nr:preprotein translocase subunit SecE [Clostridiales bacterium]